MSNETKRSIIVIGIIFLLLLMVYEIASADGIEDPHIYTGVCITKKGKSYWAGPNIHWVNMPVGTVLTVESNYGTPSFKPLKVKGAKDHYVFSEVSGHIYSQNLLKLQDFGYNISYEYLDKEATVYIPSASEAAESFPNLDPCPFPYAFPGRN